MPLSKLHPAVVSRAGMVLFILITLGLLAGGYAYYRKEAREIHAEKYQTIAAIGDLKSAQILQWRRERIADVTLLASGPNVVRAAEALSKDPTTPAPRDYMLKLLGTAVRAYRNSDALVMDLDGKVVLSTGNTPHDVSPATQRAILAADAGSEATLSDFFRLPDGSVHIDAVAAMRDPDGRAIGKLILRSDAATYLNPLIQSWPTSSRTGETLLLQREGDEVVVFNRLRHRSAPPLSMRMPLSQSRLPIARLERERHVLVEGPDYRNESVLADVCVIPGTTWWMVTKVDSDEILAEARQRALVIGVIVGLFSLLAGAGIAYLHRQRQAELLRDLYESERQQREAQQAAIVERRQAEETLRESVGRFEQASRATYNVIWDFDFRTQQTWINDNFLELFGHSPSEFQAEKFWTDLIHPEDKKRVLSAYGVVVDSDQEFWSDEFRMSRKDGTWGIVQVRGLITRDEEGRAIRMIGATSDITKQRQDEESLRVQARILDSVGQAVVATDNAGTIIYVNRYAGELYGWAPDEMVGKNAIETLVPETGVEQGTEIVEGLGRGESWSGEFVVRRKDGTTFPAHVTDAPLFDKDGNVAGAIGISIDLTERKRLEAQFMQAQKMETIGRLAGGVAHDFNNLLTVINGTADLASVKLTNDDPSRADFLQIKLAGERAAMLIRKLLAISRKQIMKRESLNLNTVITEWRTMLEGLAGDRIDLVVRAGEGNCNVFADPVHIEQVVLNLTVNARDAMPQGGILTIETRAVELDATDAGRHPAVRPGPHVMLAVSDTGIGMDEATRSRIFEPFFTTKEPGKGTGLGLATVYGIVQQSEGGISVESEVGKGTTIRIYLPQIASPAPQPVGAGAERPPSA